MRMGVITLRFSADSAIILKPSIPFSTFVTGRNKNEINNEKSMPHAHTHAHIHARTHTHTHTHTHTQRRRQVK